VRRLIENGVYSVAALNRVNTVGNTSESQGKHVFALLQALLMVLYELYRVTSSIKNILGDE